MNPFIFSKFQIGSKWLQGGNADNFDFSGEQDKFWGQMYIS